MSPNLSIVLPAKNEEGNIGPLISEIFHVLNPQIEFEIVLTDDGSDDNTAQEALDTATHLGCPLKILRHQQSCGQSAALHSAIRHASARLIATMDADGQNDPSDLPAMVAQANQLAAEHFCIAGYRQQRRDSRWIRFQSIIANSVRQFFLRDGVPDSGCGLKVFPKQTFLLLPYFDHMHRFLPALIRRIEGDIIVHPVKHRPRCAGRSNYTLRKRLWAGMVDLCGVMWLRRRTCWPVVQQKYPEEP
ncbi:glycosyltransferase family 2 protein [Vibrio sp. CAU 1672]|uniref:glycosyltransferase family 2 protein n=1 Tax=Vibrio sp. CAU 1672 TaxID=3032594 RepID=UPI0023D9AAD2|nr:glycosyltransferase family 2 protein [Vibrio sp. CAU 1672]MDF2152922.1 glycosyltransferase family 2 protein [Vibrio sp. CAU 1672]